MGMDVCQICDGSGLRIVVRDDGSRVAKDCECRIERRVARMIARTNIPKRYEHCTLDSYDTDFPSASRSLKAAHRSAKKFVESYPIDTRGTGLLLTG